MATEGTNRKAPVKEGSSDDGVNSVPAEQDRGSGLSANTCVIAIDPPFPFEVQRAEAE